MSEDIRVTLKRKGFFRQPDGSYSKAGTVDSKVPMKTNPASHLPKDGSTFKGRKHSSESKKKMSDFWKKWHQENPHPKGMKGKHHSPEFIERIRQRHAGVEIPTERVLAGLKTKVARYGSLAPMRIQATWKAGWRLVGDRKIYFRSRWEANYGRYLEFLKKVGQVASWEHEPTTFWFTSFGIKRGCVSYLPDFHVLYSDGHVEYHEVKGWMDAASKTKIRRFRKYYSEHILVILNAAWFKANARKLSGLVEGWE